MDSDLWLDSYIEAFAACGRGERDPAALMGYYAPPVLLTTDDICVRLDDERAVLGWAEGQIEGMQAAGFDHIEVLDRAVERVNATSALVRGAFARRRSDGSEIARITASYLVVTRSEGPRITALLVHTPHN